MIIYFPIIHMESYTIYPVQVILCIQFNEITQYNANISLVIEYAPLYKNP